MITDSVRDPQDSAFCGTTPTVVQGNNFSLQ